MLDISNELIAISCENHCTPFQALYLLERKDTDERIAIQSISTTDKPLQLS
jgi:hypothetical protein